MLCSIFSETFLEIFSFFLRDFGGKQRKISILAVIRVVVSRDISFLAERGILIWNSHKHKEP